MYVDRGDHHQTLEKRLIVGISSIHELVDNNQIQVILVEKDRDISDILILVYLKNP